jgi:hypothetical protein
MQAPAQPTPPPDSGYEKSALPIARRIARKPVLFPLWWRGATREERMPMVGWFDPMQLATTGARSLISLLVGEQSDRRIVQALAARRQEFYDHTTHYRDGANGPQPLHDRPREELWLDFVSDTGDGWNPTYAVAYAAAQPSLRVRTNGGEVELPRGDVLVFGGDEVYPTPSREEYQRRLVAPYSTAFGDDVPAERPHVYAVPGNHDWYDGLSAFTRLFCSDIGGRRFAGWWTRQRRSYFVLKLPHNWWLIGCDSQLQSDLDVPQMEYFREIAARYMKTGDKVILCLSVPVWMYAQKYRSIGQVFDETDLIFLREEVFARQGIDVQVYLAGDIHHYRRHEETASSAGDAAPVQKIIAGGGGAFLHPTHEEDASLLIEEPLDDTSTARSFALKATYPDMKRSARLAWGNLGFLFKNPRFGIVPAVVYLLSCWLVGSSVGDAVPSTPWRALRLTLDAFAGNPGLALWTIGLVAIILAFTDTHSKAYRVLGGLAHCAAHLTAMFYVGWGALKIADYLFRHDGILRAFTTGALILLGGWTLGSFVLGIYLLISVNVFGRHSEEAFSSLRVEDYKHFLRLHIDPNGALTIWPLKIERVPRVWRKRTAADETSSREVPIERMAVELIEPPVRIDRCPDEPRLR